jgi:hypothetical protein
MNSAQQAKKLIVISPAAISDNASPTTNSIDTKGFDYLEVDVMIGASDIAMAVLKLQSSDTDGSYADVTGLIWGTSANIAGATSTLPSATDDNKIFSFQVDLRGQKRYFDLVATTGDGTAGTYITAIARLSMAKDMPTTAAEQGCAEILRI